MNEEIIIHQNQSNLEEKLQEEYLKKNKPKYYIGNRQVKKKEYDNHMIEAQQQSEFFNSGKPATIEF